MELEWQKFLTPEHLSSLVFREMRYEGPWLNLRSRNSDWTSKFTERDWRSLNGFVMKIHHKAVLKVTTELSQVSNKTIRHELKKAGYHAGDAIRKPMLSHQSIQKRFNWCRDLKNWLTGEWKQLIFSNDTCFLFSPLQCEFMYGGSSVKIFEETWRSF